MPAADSTMQDPVELIYIMGSGRSGSSLLSSMLGTQPDVFSAGEIYNYLNFFESAVERERDCSCGANLADCAFWHRVRDALRSRFDGGLVDLKQTEPAVFEHNNYGLLSTLREISGRRLIIDSSKRHYRLRLLLASPLFRVSIVHLVRDPRAYAYSSLLTELKKGDTPTVYYRKLFAWLRKNIAIRLYYGRLPGYRMLRYEDLVAAPEGVLADLLGSTGRDFVADALYSAESELHEFSGNKKFRSRGLDEIRLDTRYINKLTPAQWLLGSLQVVPGTLALGYPLFSRRPPV